MKHNETVDGESEQYKLLTDFPFVLFSDTH